MAPPEDSYRQEPSLPKQAHYQTPFQTVGQDYEAFVTGDDSDHQPSTADLVRRSRSLTGADLTGELQPTGRKRSFFSRRKSKLAQEQAELPKATPSRSFSEFLPTQVTPADLDSKPPSGRTEAKSLKLKGEPDADASSSKPKSSKWWSWGSSSKGQKQNGRVLSQQDGKGTASREAGSRNQPSNLDLSGQLGYVNGVTSSAQHAQASPLVQPGCMSMFSAAPTALEKPVSAVQWTDSEVGSSRENTAVNNSYTSLASQSSQTVHIPYVPDGSSNEPRSSTGSEQSKASRQVQHSRHVSWDDTYPETSTSGGLVDSGGYQDSNQRPFTSPFLADYQSVDGSLADNRAVPDSSSPITHSTPAPPYPLQQTAPLLSVPPPPTPRPETPSAAGIGASASVSTATAPAVAETGAQGQLPSEAENSAPALTADGERQTKGHRRGRSLTGLIPTLKTKPKRSQSQALEGEPTTPAASSSQAVRPKTPDAKGSSSNSSSLGQCFGMGKTLEEAEKEELPLGVVGLRNLGNTCFVNVALQCLRYTPKLAQAIYPDLIRFSLIEQEPVAMPVSVDSSRVAAPSVELTHSGSELPSVPETRTLADLPMQISSPSTSLNSQADGFAHSNSNSNSSAANPQHSMPSTGNQARIPMHQLLQDGQDVHASQPVAVPASHAHIPNHAASSLQDQLQGSSPETLAGSRLDSLASSDSTNISPSTDTLAGSASTSVTSTALSGALPQEQQQLPQPAQTSSHADSAQQAAGAVANPGDDSDQAPANASTAVKQAPPVAAAATPLKKGEFAESFRTLVKQVYAKGNHYAVDPAHFLRCIAQLPMGADFCDGGQHDAQELFRLLLDSLHDDLNRITTKPGYEEDKDLPGEAEEDKAQRLWRKYLCIDNSPITDLFGGQLQSTVHCHKCKGNFTTYEPFWDLSLPIVKEGKGGLGAWLSGKSIPTTIQDCLQAFTADEVLQGDEAFRCEACKEKTEATKRLRLYRLPQVMLLHIKRFKYSGSSREKLTNNVTFPIKGLKLNQFVSSASSPSESNANYDLYAVSNHYGSMAGGHYTAACRVGLPDGKEQWFNFNDDTVSKLSPQSVVTPCAYMLFYVRTE